MNSCLMYRKRIWAVQNETDKQDVQNKTDLQDCNLYTKSIALVCLHVQMYRQGLVQDVQNDTYGGKQSC